MCETGKNVAESRKGNLHEPIGMTWPKTSVQALGVFHSYDKESCIKANFYDTIDELIKQLYCWKVRNLSLAGKTLNIKTLDIAKFAQIVSMLHIP